MRCEMNTTWVQFIIWVKASSIDQKYGQDNEECD